MPTPPTPAPIADRRSTPPTAVDLAVVGGGIVGLAAAREALRRRPDLDLLVLEREADVGRHQTGHNSGVIHAGIYYPLGSLKARLCAAGARELYDYCAEHGIEARRCGKSIVAVRDRELRALDELERRARLAGVPGLRRLGPQELRELEPHASGVAALHSPQTGVVDFGAVARALAADIEAGGGTISTAAPVVVARTRREGVLLRHPTGETLAQRAIFCAGPWADRLAVACGAPSEPRIVPFRGAYLRLRPERAHLVRALIYPVPDARLPFLGVHLTRHADGEVLVGPSALPAATRDVLRDRPVAGDVRSTLAWPGSARLARRFWRAGLGELRRAASRQAVAQHAARYVPELGAADLLPAFSGIRAQALDRDGQLVDDFVVSETEHAVHVRNAPSPAATSALALARLIVDQLDGLAARAGVAVPG